MRRCVAWLGLASGLGLGLALTLALTLTGVLAGAKVRGLAADFIRNFSALYGELQASKCW